MSLNLEESGVPRPAWARRMAHGLRSERVGIARTPTLVSDLPCFLTRRRLVGAGAITAMRSSQPCN